jgi:hypothetical protein
MHAFLRGDHSVSQQIELTAHDMHVRMLFEQAGFKVKIGG